MLNSHAYSIRDRRFCFGILIAFTGLWHCSLGYAAEWKVNSDVSQDLAYEDNVKMSLIPQASMSYRITPTLNLLRKTESSEVAANLSYGTQRYENIPGLNQDIQSYGLKGSYMTEAWQWGLEGNYNAAPTRNSAVGDAGNFASNAIRTVQSIQPLLVYKLNERNSLSLSPSYSETSYSTRDFSGNNSKSISLSWQRQWSEVYQASLSFAVSNYQFQRVRGLVDTNTATNSYSINFSNDYALSEKWKVNASIGIRRTQNKSTVDIAGFEQVRSNSSTGFLTDSGVTYKNENFTSEFKLSRSLVPSGQGQLQEQSSVNLDCDYGLTKELSTALTTGYRQSKSTNPDQTTTRENIVIEPSVNWKFSKDWRLSGSYRYRTQDNSNRNKTVDSNLFMLTIDYNWQGLSFSR